jgi:hypothetical protein
VLRRERQAGLENGSRRWLGNPAIRTMNGGADIPVEVSFEIFGSENSSLRTSFEPSFPPHTEGPYCMPLRIPNV